MSDSSLFDLGSSLERVTSGEQIGHATVAVDWPYTAHTLPHWQSLLCRAGLSIIHFQTPETKQDIKSFSSDRRVIYKLVSASNLRQIDNTKFAICGLDKRLVGLKTN